MEIIKFGHACVRLEKDGRVVVIDPGGYTEPESVEGADAVIITHGHHDHLHAATIMAAYRANPGLQVFAPADALTQLPELGDAGTALAASEELDVVGFGVQTFGGEHATIVEGFDVPQNVGVVVDGSLCYPGDSFALPGMAVERLLVPVAGPWMKIAEAVAYVRAVAPERAHPTHDAIYTQGGLDLVDGWLERATDTACSRLPIGTPAPR